MTNVWPHGDPREVVRAIVADSRYGLSARVSAPQTSWFDVARDWLAGIVRGLIQRLDRALGDHNPFEAAIGFVVIGAAFALGAWAVFVLVRASGRGSRPRLRSRVVDGGAAVAQNSAELRGLARDAARARRYRDAAALLFAAAIRALDECGRLAFDPARTPGEYRRLVGDPLFDAFAGDAIVALFAAAEPHDDLYERMSGTYDRFFNPARDTPTS